FARLMGKLKLYASTSTDVAIAPGLKAVKSERPLAVLRERRLGGADFVLIGVPVILGLLCVAAITGSWPGIAALPAFHLQPLIAFAGTRLRAPDVILIVLFRWPLDVWGWLMLLLEKGSGADVDSVAAKRPDYEKLVAGGLEPFFEPRREQCPLCGSDAL